jgi:pimeloyl-ACP methyl ester carboxylesterase
LAGARRRLGPWENVLDTDSFSWVLPDYRGYGVRMSEAGQYNLEEITADLLELFDTEIADRYESVTVLGHSMGGAYAQQLFRHRGHSIEAFVGVSPVPASGSPMPEPQRALFDSAGNQVEARRAIIDITTGNRLSRRWLDTMAGSTAYHPTDEAVTGHFHARADCNFLGEMGQVTVPALAIVGIHDPAVTAEGVCGTYGQSFQDLQVVEYPDAGHYVMFEAPVRLATDIENFLRARLPALS